MDDDQNNDTNRGADVAGGEHGGDGVPPLASLFGTVAPSEKKETIRRLRLFDERTDLRALSRLGRAMEFGCGDDRGCARGMIAHSIDDAGDIRQDDTPAKQVWSAFLRPDWLPRTQKPSFVGDTRIDRMPVGGDAFYVLSTESIPAWRPDAKTIVEKHFMRMQERMKPKPKPKRKPITLVIGDHVVVDGRRHLFLGATLSGRLAFADASPSGSQQRGRMKTSLRPHRIEAWPSTSVH